jgi:hypothetical protein
MSLLLEGVARLNLSITGSLMDDDLIDEIEEEAINAQMVEVIQLTVELIKLVQSAFGKRNRLTDQTVRLDIPEAAQPREKSPRKIANEDS